MIDITKARKAWADLHEIGLAVDSPSSQRVFMLDWFRYVRDVIDCQSCLWKLALFLDRWPVEYGEGFYLWGVCLHDYVNKELGKKLFYPELTLAPLTKKGILQ